MTFMSQSPNYRFSQDAIEQTRTEINDLGHLDFLGTSNLSLAILVFSFGTALWFTFATQFLCLESMSSSKTFLPWQGAYHEDFPSLVLASFYLFVRYSYPSAQTLKSCSASMC